MKNGRISIAGTGYVSLSTAVGFAINDYKVITLTHDPEKARKINKGTSCLGQSPFSNVKRYLLHYRGSLSGARPRRPASVWADFNSIVANRVLPAG